MTGPGEASVSEVDEPVAGEYEARVDMVVCGICNSTDRMLRLGTFAPGVTYPSILGHESVGRVTAVGSRAAVPGARSARDPLQRLRLGGPAGPHVLGGIR